MRGKEDLFEPRPKNATKPPQTVKPEKSFTARDNGLAGRRLRRLTLQQQTIVLNLLLI
jgi:hypothetical protein